MNAFLMLAIRHGLTTLGGALATHGVIAAGEVETFIGAATVLAGVVLSAIEKVKRKS